MYAKIFRQIFESSIADDWHTRVVFQDMLVLADSGGVVDMTHEALARITNVPLDIIKKAVEALEAPDARSRNPEAGGARIVRIDEHRDWGWSVVNYDHYRKIASEEQRKEKTRVRVEALRRRRSHNADVTQCNAPVTQVDAPVTPGNACNARQKETEKEERKSTSPSAPVAAKASTPPEAKTVLDHLNLKAGRQFRATPQNLKLIAARLWDVGGDLEGVLATVDRKVAQWKGDPKMDEYLRPETLFGKQKFGGYYDTRAVPVHPNGATPTPTSQPAVETPEQRDRRILWESQR